MADLWVIIIKNIYNIPLSNTTIEGGAVAIDLASRAEYADKIWCLVVENTFTSIPEMAKVLLGWRLLHYLPLLCYKNKVLL